MRKFAICIILALAMVLVGGANTRANATCITLTNFCDKVQLAADPVESEHVYGKWDWTCTGNATSIYGRNQLFGRALVSVFTRPVYGTYTFPYTAGFVFNKATHLFDLPATDGDSAFFFQQSQPWTSSPGSCGLAPHTRSGNQRSALGR